MYRSLSRAFRTGILAVTFLGTSPVTAAEPPAPHATGLLSMASDGTSGDGASLDPSLSADGSTVAFASLATNLSTGPPGGTLNVFVRHQLSGRTVRVSEAADGTAGNDHSTDPAVSGDGSVVAFQSFATNLVERDGNGASDVFVRDLTSGHISQVSVASDGTPGNADSFAPSVSADGRFVAFASEATGLVPGDRNRSEDVFVHDRTTRETIKVSVASDGKPGNGNSFAPSISADGRFVAFASEATNLVPRDTNGAIDVFVYDRETSRTSRVSVASDGAQAAADVFTPAISGDGRFVAFASVAANLVPGDVNRASDVFVNDRRAGRTVLVSRGADGGLSSRGSFAPVLSAAGGKVAFVTDGALVADDTNNTEDIYIFDLGTNDLHRESLASDGSQATRPSMGPSLSGDGAAVAFQSLATLDRADANGAVDVFLHR